MAYRVINVEFVGTLPGGVSQPFDRAVVVDDARTEPNVLTGRPQPVTAYRGTLAGAHAFIRTHTEGGM